MVVMDITHASCDQMISTPQTDAVNSMTSEEIDAEKGPVLPTEDSADNQANRVPGPVKVHASSDSHQLQRLRCKQFAMHRLKDAVNSMTSEEIDAEKGPVLPTEDSADNQANRVPGQVKVHDAVNSMTSEEINAEKAHVVLQYRAQFIQDASTVMAIVDSLGTTMVHREVYAEIQAEKTSMDQMRKLYTAVVEPGGTNIRAAFYNALKQHQPLLLEKFVTESASFSSSPGPVLPTEDSADNQGNRVPAQVKVHDEKYLLSSRPGLCVMICNENFESMEPRVGLKRNAVDVARTFSGLGFRVLMYKDQTMKQMKKTLKHLSSLNNPTEQHVYNVQEWSREEMEYTDLNVENPPKHGDAFVCYISSLGSPDCVLGTDGEPLYTDDITTTFNGANCLVLGNKPKVFLFEAPQGYGYQNEEDSMVPMEADFLVVMGSKMNTGCYSSHRHGSQFTQSLCKQMKKGCHRGEEIQTILNQVINEVSHMDPSGEKQIPEVKINTLTKNLVFSPISN